MYVDLMSVYAIVKIRIEKNGSRKVRIRTGLFSGQL